MEGSEEYYSRWARSSNSRALNNNPYFVSSSSLGLPPLVNNPRSSSRDASASGKPAGGVDGEEREDQEVGRRCRDRERSQLWGGRRNPNRNNEGKGGGVVDDSAVAGGRGGGVSLREWLDKPERAVNLLECLHIFRQIVEMVSSAHAQGIVVNNIRPSCFVMSTINRVTFIESASCSTSGSGSDTCEEKGSDGRHREPCDSLRHHPTTLRAEYDPSGSCRLRLSSGQAARISLVEEAEESRRGMEGSGILVGEGGERKKSFPLKQILLMEFNWYTSPEEAAGGPCSFATDVYRLGVLLFELFCTFTSLEEKLRTMSNLRHRVLSPQLLLKWPKEASFCLWLLHPQSSTRPKMSEVIQSDFLNGPRDSIEEREAAIKLREEIEDQELVLEFLVHLQQKKQETADKLHDIICCLSSDIEEVTKQRSALKKGGAFLELEKDEHSALDRVDVPLLYPDRVEDSESSVSRKRFRPGPHQYNEENDEHLSEGFISGTQPKDKESISSKTSRLMKNFKKLESAYFLTRCRTFKPAGKVQNRILPVSSVGRGSTARTEGSSVDNLVHKEASSGGRKSEWINPFLDGLHKYLSFSKLNVRADLKQGDLLSSSNLVCSLAFDRDKELFATAGVNKKIKVFECDAILNEDRDIHYPVVEMASRSKLSSICWNSYIKSQIASSDFEGVVQVWDVTRNQVFVEMREHERRVWSVDFSTADPTKLASGSDDCTVKLWNINQVGSIGTIKTKANVCCVQFPPDSGQSLAIGSADHRIYFYDLRNLRIPWCTLVGHTKTVSYVKFIDLSTIVSASTDNSLKIWDLSLATSRVLDSAVQSFTGHTNVKNFVGLSVYDGYIATGSETNEVCVYHKAFPMPMLSYKFNATDAISGRDVDDASQFISCVCWRGQSNTLVAANSSGNVKLLDMV